MNDHSDMHLATSAEPARDGGPFEAADFIKERIAELAALARRHRLDLLGYLLDMAHLEAEEACRRGHQDPL